MNFWKRYTFPSKHTLFIKSDEEEPVISISTHTRKNHVMDGTRVQTVSKYCQRQWLKLISIATPFLLKAATKLDNFGSIRGQQNVHPYWSPQVVLSQQFGIIDARVEALFPTMKLS